MSPVELWQFLPRGYALTVAVEIPVLWFALSRRHDWRVRLGAGLALTAFTYPIVVLVLPLLMAGYSRTAYLVVAETFAPLAECLLFWFVYDLPRPGTRRELWQDMGAIVAANLASFGLGEMLPGGW